MPTSAARRTLKDDRERDTRAAAALKNLGRRLGQGGGRADTARVRRRRRVAAAPTAMARRCRVATARQPRRGPDPTRPGRDAARHGQLRRVPPEAPGHRARTRRRAAIGADDGVTYCAAIRGGFKARRRSRPPSAQAGFFKSPWIAWRARWMRKERVWSVCASTATTRQPPLRDGVLPQRGAAAGSATSTGTAARLGPGYAAPKPTLAQVQPASALPAVSRVHRQTKDCIATYADAVDTIDEAMIEARPESLGRTSSSRRSTSTRRATPRSFWPTARRSARRRRARSRSRSSPACSGASSARSRSGAAAAARARAAATRPRPPPVARGPPCGNQILGAPRHRRDFHTGSPRGASAGPPRWAALEAAAAAASAAAALGRARASVAAAAFPRAAAAAIRSPRRRRRRTRSARPAAARRRPRRSRSSSPSASRSTVSREEKDAMIAQLVGMGYPTDKARRGLRRSGWDGCRRPSSAHNGGAEGTTLALLAPLPLTDPRSPPL